LLIPQDIPSLSVLIKESLYRVVLPYTVAASLGLGIVYFIAYFGGKPLIDKFKNYLRLLLDGNYPFKEKFKGTIFSELINMSLLLKKLICDLSS